MPAASARDAAAAGRDLASPAWTLTAFRLPQDVDIAVPTMRSTVEGGAWVAIVSHDAMRASPRGLARPPWNDLAGHPVGCCAWRDAPTAP